MPFLGYGGGDRRCACVAWGNDTGGRFTPPTNRWSKCTNATAVPSTEIGPPTQRDCHLKIITEEGRLAWQVFTGYGQRSLVETTMGR
jgi:hypothetical protein